MRTIPLLLLALAPTLGPAQQTLVFVDARAGDDVNGNGSAQSPYRTLTRAVSRATTLADPVLRVRAGTYDRALGATPRTRRTHLWRRILPRVEVW